MNHDWYYYSKVDEPQSIFLKPETLSCDSFDPVSNEPWSKLLIRVVYWSSTGFLLMMPLGCIKGRLTMAHLQLQV